MFKEILFVFVAIVALTMAYPENETPKTGGQDATQTQTHGVEEEGLNTAESANYYGGYYGYRPHFYGGYQPYYGGHGYGGYPHYGGYPYYGGGFRKQFYGYWG